MLLLVLVCLISVSLAEPDRDTRSRFQEKIPCIENGKFYREKINIIFNNTLIKISNYCLIKETHYTKTLLFSSELQIKNGSISRMFIFVNRNPNVKGDKVFR